ncbi:protein TolA [Bradyrhizobium sp. U87765 SZCCT0131]|nr:protein TolA [Bradyrhizobium sp. U87765 SZCCT0131]MBR1260372.1 protein TolA [Bradyrhizobium sp. U87765 SZCCT0134]MBR1307379.1 protein TolA [Bradyrhizobium sp. U87765 SZCCT0110]MBR1321333.1 protein TolA [Bradyrhizobium sp. U87765 SZCCT0109]MBR1349646.1 protein TolA [Bradyrhizobium sp. U87765 SZCCT0048]
MGKVQIDKTLVASLALHAAVLGWSIVSFSTRSLEATPVESMPVDIISDAQFSQLTAGNKSGKKENPKPLVEKVADATPPQDDPVGKITEKKEVVTAAAPEPPPKPVEKPVEKKPDPPKQAEKKDEPKPVEKQPEPKVDPIAEALKKDNSKKPPPKPEAKAAPPQPPKPKQDYKFDQSKIAALIDKREPSHQAVTGSALNASASLGSPRGTAQTLSQSEMDAMRARLASLWNIQPGTENPEELMVTVRIRLTPDRRLAGPPEVVSRGSSPRYRAAADAAVRAVLQGQPYNMLRDQTYDQWKFMDIDFDPKTMFRS